MLSLQRLKHYFSDSLARNAFYLTGGGAASSIFGFIFWLLAARLYSTDEVGKSAALIAAFMLLASFSNLGLGYGLIRFLPANSAERSTLINCCFTLGSVISVIAAIIFLLGLSLWSPALLFVRESPVLISLFVLFTLAATLTLLTRDAFVALKSTQFSLWQSLSSSILRVVMVVILFYFYSAAGIFLSAGLAATAALVIALFFFLPKSSPGYMPRPTIRRELVSEISRYSFGNYVADWSRTAPGFVLPLMILNLLSAESNAYFYISWSIAGILLVIPINFSYSLLAEGSHNEASLLTNTRRALKITLPIILLLIAVIFLAGDKILAIFGQAYSQNATTLLWLLALSALPIAFTHIYIFMQMVKKDMRKVIAASIIPACLTLGLSYVLLGKLGLIGIGVGSLAANSVVAIAILFSLRTGLLTSKRQIED